MTFAELKAEVELAVNDDTYNSLVPGYINEAFLQASGEVNMPDLKRIGVATTAEDKMYTSLAGLRDGFNGRLTKLTDSTIQRADSLETMMSWIEDNNRTYTENGPVEIVALEGKTLWYFPIPKPAQNISCVLFSNPPKMVDDEDTPDAFPEVCHRNIGIHGAAMIHYGNIEDGIEGDKVNTSYHTAMYQKGIQQLIEWIGRHRIHHISSTLNDDIATQQPIYRAPRVSNGY